MSKSSKNASRATLIGPFNPFAVTLEGLSQLFSKAQSVGMLFLLIAVGSAAYGLMGPSPAFTKDPTGKSTEHFVKNALDAPLDVKLTWVGMAIILSLFILVVTTMLHGIASYSALQLSKGRTVRLGEAFNAVLENFGRYFLLIFLMNVKLVLWTALFIVPGIIAYYRYTFAGMLFFDEEKKLRGDAALQESSRLAKKGLMTIFASQFLFNVITFFYADRLIMLGSQAVLYREYTALDKSKTDKPKPHPLSRIALGLPIALFILLLIYSISPAGR